MKKVYSKDLVVGKVYADSCEDWNMTLLRYIGRGMLDDIFMYVGGVNSYISSIGDRLQFDICDILGYYEPTDEIMERFGVEHKVPKNKRVCN